MNVREILCDAYNRQSLAAIYIDLQPLFVNAPFAMSYGSLEAAQVAKEFSEKARTRQIPNYWVLTAAHPLEGVFLTLDDVAKLDPERQFKFVEPLNDEPIINKHTRSAITIRNPSLHNRLMDSHKNVHLYFGVNAGACVASTIEADILHSHSYSQNDNVHVIAIHDGVNASYQTPEEYEYELRELRQSKQLGYHNIHVTDSSTVYECLGL